MSNINKGVTTHRTCSEETVVKGTGMRPVKVLLLRRLFCRARWIISLLYTTKKVE
jgi:hypothetical protein